MRLTNVRLPTHIQEKVATFGEFAYGATRVIVTLKDGRRISDVIVAWTTDIVRVDNSEQIPFNPEEIIDVEEQK